MAYLDPHHTNQLHIFAQLFRDALTEYTYAADLAGLTYSLSNSKYGLTVSWWPMECVCVCWWCRLIYGVMVVFVIEEYESVRKEGIR